MAKAKLGPQTLVYPMPTFLVGANVDNKPNFMTVAWGSIANLDPPMVSVAMNHKRHSNKGIKQTNTFSVNIPSVDLVKETDYCGIISGSEVNKINDCKFDVFYGKLKTAPMIEQCPINLECSVVHILDLGTHDLIVGKIEETFINEECLTNGKPDVSKVKPFTYNTGHELTYREIGKVVAKAFNVGKELKIS